MSDLAFIGPGGRERRPEPLLRTLLGDVLRRNRLEQRRTLADVAREARVSMPYLSELERGRKEASSEVLAAICVALRIDLSDVLTEAGRDLAADRAHRRTAVVARQARPRWPSRTQAVSGRAAAAGRTRGPGDVVCLAA